MGRQKNVTASSGLYDVKVSISYSNSCTLHSGYFTGCVMASVDGSDGYIMENYLAIAVDYTVVMMVSDCRCLEFSYFCLLPCFFFPFVFIIAYFVSSFVFLGRASSVAHILSPEKKYHINFLYLFLFAIFLSLLLMPLCPSISLCRDYSQTS